MNQELSRPGTIDGTMTQENPSNSVPSHNRIKNINIRQLDHGFIVEVGCQTVAIENTGRLISLLAEYIGDPNKIEAKYLAGELL